MSQKSSNEVEEVEKVLVVLGICLSLLRVIDKLGENVFIVRYDDKKIEPVNVERLYRIMKKRRRPLINPQPNDKMTRSAKKHSRCAYRHFRKQHCRRHLL